jgi:hypothetical protein
MAEPILSPDGNLEITRHSLVYPPMGPKSVQGAVKNNGTGNADARIKVDFFDESGNLLGDSVGTFKDIQPGETRLFDIWAERLPNMYEIESHKISFVTGE